MAIRSLTAPASYGHLCSSVIYQVNTRRQGIFPSVGIYTNVCNLCNYPFFVIHRQPKSSLQLTKALLVLSRNTIAILIYLYLLLGHISPSADQIDAFYLFVSRSARRRLLFPSTKPINFLPACCQHLHVVLIDFQHASTSSRLEPRNERYWATKSKKLPKALYTISSETMSNCSSQTSFRHRL